MRLVDRRVPSEQRVARVQLDDGGFIMVALLVGIAISAIWMTALLPAWHQQETREREAELIFRGEQYARAIYLFRQKNQTPPPNIDTLVSQKYLRKKYLDPITGKDFLPVGGVSATPVSQGAQGFQISTQAGITGVRSTSNATSITIYLNQQSYSQFPFDWSQEAQRSGTVVPQLGPGRGGQAGRGGPGGRGDGGGRQTVPDRGGPGGRGDGGGRQTVPDRGGPGAGGVVGPGRGR
jgi:type II secretory pathway pseudopilin PulG